MTYRDRDPHEQPVAPHRDGLDDAPLPNAHIPQREPEENGHPDPVRVHERHGGREQAEVVLEHGGGGVLGVGEVRRDGRREGGGEEEREDESGERPEGAVEVGVGG